jgi:arylsulfatase A
MPARHEYNKDRAGWTQAYREQLNMPRMLKAADPRYCTAHFGKWDHRYDEISPVQQEYDFSDGYTGNGNGGNKGSGGPAATPDPKLIDTITDQALHFIDRQHHTNTPFYLQVSHYAVHLDIYYNQETLDHIRKLPAGRKHNMPEFAAMTADMDDSIGRIIDKLSQLDLLNNTWVVFLSDNGGRNSIPKAAKIKEHRNAPLRNGKHSFYEGGIRVPFIILGPGVKPGSVNNVPVCGVDLLPTFADLADYSSPLPDDIDGGSLRPILDSRSTDSVQRPHPFLVFHQGVDRKPVSAIRVGDYKLVKTWKENRLELFDLSIDISEADDLSGRMPDRTQKLDALLTKYLDEVGGDIPRSGN